MIDLKEISFDEREKLLYTVVELDVLSAFQCDFCKKVFKKINIKTYDKIPIQFPVLRYSTPGNHFPCNYELNFCSFSCLFELLKKVPFGYEINAPIYFNDMDKRNEYFFKDWKIIDKIENK